MINCLPRGSLAVKVKEGGACAPIVAGGVVICQLSLIAPVDAAFHSFVQEANFIV